MEKRKKGRDEGRKAPEDMREDRIQIRGGNIALDIKFDYNWKDGRKEWYGYKKNKSALVIIVNVIAETGNN